MEGAKQIDRNYFPARSNDIPSRPALTLCVLGFDRPATEKGTTDLIESMIRDCGSSGRTYKSALLFSVPDVGDAVRDAARNLLAWEDIDDDEDTQKRVDEADDIAQDSDIAIERRTQRTIPIWKEVNAVNAAMVPVRAAVTVRGVTVAQYETRFQALQAKKNIRILECPPLVRGGGEIRAISGGLLVQAPTHTLER